MMKFKDELNVKSKRKFKISVIKSHQNAWHPKSGKRLITDFLFEINLILENIMNFKANITTLREELSSKYRVVRKETKINDKERRLQLIEKIQLTVWKIMADIANGQSPVFKSIPLATWQNCNFSDRIKFKSNGKTKQVDFKNRNSRMEFTSIIFLLSKIHKLLMREQTSTRREIYYQNLKIFKSQIQVDNGIKEISYLLNSPSWELRVSSTSKGIISGPVVFYLRTGEVVDCSTPGGVYIPQNVLQIENISSSANWALIVEKDACFQKLIQPGNKLESCIFITCIVNVKGKGFPDVSSRILVCKLWEHLQIPILALVDADPHGFEVMCVYRFGSLAMSPYSMHLACPAVRWLGIHPSDIRPLLLESKTLSFNDRKKIRFLLKRDYVKENEHLKSQLEILLEGNVKAEIEGVGSISLNYLINVYLMNKIKCKEYL